MKNRVVLLIIFFTALACFISYSDSKSQKIRADITLFSLAASRVYYNGGNPYDRQEVGKLYKYLPTNFIILKPLTYLNDYQAQGIWFSFNLFLIFMAFIVARKFSPTSRTISFWVTIFTLTCVLRLIASNIKLGQWNTSVFCLSIIGLYLIHKKNLWGSVLVGLGGTLKFMPIFFIPYFALRKQWKIAGVITLSTLFWMIAFPIITVGPTETYDLAQKAIHTANRRVESITKGEVVGSISLHSTVYRWLTSAYMELDNEYYRSNIVDLPNKTAANIAKVVSIIIFIIVARFVYKKSKGIPIELSAVNLALLGTWYCLWYVIMPGIRPAQTISIMPACFVLGLAAALSHGKTRQFLFISCGIVFVMLLSTSELIRNSTYQNYLLASGVQTYAIVFLLCLNMYIVNLLTNESSSADLKVIPIRSEDPLG